MDYVAQPRHRGLTALCRSRIIIKLFQIEFEFCLVRSTRIYFGLEWSFLSKMMLDVEQITPFANSSTILNFTGLNAAWVM